MQTAPGAEDAHYLAKKMANLKQMARDALVPFKNL